MKGNILFKTKQLRILLALRDNSQKWYIATLAKATDTTYVHACNFIAACEGLGIMQSEKHGKIKHVRLTEKGAKIADSLASISTSIGQEVQKPQEAVKS